MDFYLFKHRRDGSFDDERSYGINVRGVLFGASTMGAISLFLGTPGQVSAQWGYDLGYGGYGPGHFAGGGPAYVDCYAGFGRGIRSFGYGPGDAYGMYGLGWHATSHWDDHHGVYLPHGDHLHYEPGHEYWHDDFHWH